MNYDNYDFDGIDEDIIKRERAKARELRNSRWWHNKIGKAICHYCNDPKAVKDLTMDHIVPLARGGRSVKNNLVPCCKECNTKKKTLLPIEWQDYMDAKISNK